MMDMASVGHGGCEFDSTKKPDITPIFATNNFFRLLGIDQIDPKKATLGQLRAIKAKLMGDISIVEKKEESTLIHAQGRCDKAVCATAGNARG
ncbi:MAG: hypothetical protein V8Q79_02775 [Christensenellales bacterium]